MLRPLPPFRVRPLKKVSIRKAPASSTDFSDEEIEISIKGLRRPLRLTRPLAVARLKVLGRTAALT
jgi:hypothetical protein